MKRLFFPHRCISFDEKPLDALNDQISARELIQLPKKLDRLLRRLATDLDQRSGSGDYRAHILIESLTEKIITYHYIMGNMMDRITIDRLLLAKDNPAISMHGQDAPFTIWELEEAEKFRMEQRERREKRNAEWQDRRKIIEKKATLPRPSQIILPPEPRNFPEFECDTSDITACLASLIENGLLPTWLEDCWKHCANNKNPCVRNSRENMEQFIRKFYRKYTLQQHIKETIATALYNVGIYYLEHILDEAERAWSSQFRLTKLNELNDKFAGIFQVTPEGDHNWPFRHCAGEWFQSMTPAEVAARVSQLLKNCHTSWRWLTSDKLHFMYSELQRAEIGLRDTIGPLLQYQTALEKCFQIDRHAGEFSWNLDCMQKSRDPIPDTFFPLETIQEQYQNARISLRYYLHVSESKEADEIFSLSPSHTIAIQQKAAIKSLSLTAFETQMSPELLPHTEYCQYVFCQLEKIDSLAHARMQLQGAMESMCTFACDLILDGTNDILDKLKKSYRHLTDLIHDQPADDPQADIFRQLRKKNHSLNDQFLAIQHNVWGAPKRLDICQLVENTCPWMQNFRQLQKEYANYKSEMDDALQAYSTKIAEQEMRYALLRLQEKEAAPFQEALNQLHEWFEEYLDSLKAREPEQFPAIFAEESARDINDTLIELQNLPADSRITLQHKIRITEAALKLTCPDRTHPAAAARLEQFIQLLEIPAVTQIMTSHRSLPSDEEAHDPPGDKLCRCVQHFLSACLRTIQRATHLFYAPASNRFLRLAQQLTNKPRQSLPTASLSLG